MSLFRLDPGRSPLRILLVEDDEDDYVFIRDLLLEMRPGHEVDWISEYDRALEAMAEGCHDLYLLDYRLEARTGADLLSEERLQGLTAPVIVLTGVGEREADEAAMRAGASDFLTKGQIDSARLERSIRYTVEAKRQEEFQRFLADTTRLLNASLEFQTSAGAAARVVVPELADWSCLFVAEAEITPSALEVVHHDPSRDPAVERLTEWLREHAPGPLGREALANARAVFLDPEMSESQTGWFEEKEFRELVDEMGFAAGVVVPILGKARVRGTLSLISSHVSRCYREADRPFFEELGRAVALDLENARLFEAGREATRVRDEVLSMVSHDLGNPLAAVSIAAGRIESRLKKVQDPEITRFVEMIRSAADSMERLIDDLLDVGRIETGGHFGIDRQPEDVAEMLTAVEERFRPRAEAKEVELVLDVDDPLPDVMADRERMIQVLSNLLSNALKFTADGRRIVIRVRRDGPDVLFSVEDAGLGMSEEEMEHLFDRFWQARRHRRAGAGLGLTITKEIVEAHGGRIWARSREREGSTFFFTLPTVEPSDLG